jgi:uncharacterized protein
MFTRTIENQIITKLFKKKAIIIYWPRQVGKTTLVKKIIQQYEKSHYMTGDDPSTRASLTNPSLQELQKICQNHTIIVIDEAQRIENIGITMKLIIDNIPHIQLIATWSSSFELAQSISEPLTGRVYLFHLYPIAWWELGDQYNYIELKTLHKQFMLTGAYPDIISSDDPIGDLKNIVNSYLYKDILEFHKIKRSDAIMTLLQALAFQIWSEVSYHELAQTVGIDKLTVEKYIDLLEKSFVIFRLPSLARNARNELKKSKKIYFWDCGVRNAVIDAFSPINLRSDVWALWENFWIAERMKFLSYSKQHKQSYFRRTKQQQEIDYIEYGNMYYDAFELKRSWVKQPSIPTTFANNYDHSFHIINPQNFEEWLIEEKP